MSDNQCSINQRAQGLLKLIVQRYIREGMPVGSKALVEEGDVKLSSATIRNIMAELEANGYLESPHRSAGRVPTDRGYRLFVDSLLSVQPVDQQQISQFKQQLNPDLQDKGLVKRASNLISTMTKLTGVVSLPKRDVVKLRQVEFLPLSDNRVLVILVTNEKDVQNQIIYTDRTYSSLELQQAGSYLSSTFAGCHLADIREKLLTAMRHDSELAHKAFQTATQQQHGDYVVAGESLLFDIMDSNKVDDIRSLFDAFSEKQAILHLLDKCVSAPGVQIFIGQESETSQLDCCSIVTAPYEVDGNLVGALGVIGPTRMAYERVIPIVDVTAKLLSAALNSE